MTEMTRYDHGVFCWVDYVAHDMKAASDWYCQLLGWEAEAQDTGGGPPYTMFRSKGKVVAGIGQMSDEMKSAGVPPMWNDYVSVDDIEAVAKAVAEHGGNVTVPPMKVMEAGWVAYFTDPLGAGIAVWKAGQHFGSQLVNEHGALSWNEHVSRDVSGAKDFYGKVFGWDYQAIPMDEFDYTIIKNGDRDNGGIMPMEGPHWEGIPPHWMTYIAVDDCDAIADKAASTGGKIHVPPKDIPAGRFAVLADPQGGVFTAIKLNNPA